MKKYKLAILRNETDEDHIGWVDACKENDRVESFDVIDLTRDDWMDQVTAIDYDCFLIRPPGQVGYFKQMYDERVYILNKILNKQIYPSYEELIIYENKRMLAYWLKANEIPHANTHIFYHKEEAIKFANESNYPFVAKTAIGASASGVKIINDRHEAIRYINTAFSSRGIKRKWLPNLRKGRILKRIKARLNNINETYSYLKVRYKNATIEPQRYYVIFQEHLDVAEEWRCVRVGESFFAHKKQRRGNLFSGGGGIDWDPPTLELFDFMKMVTDKRGFNSLSIDIFVTTDGKHYINELQCFFGWLHPLHQMIINEVPGRYVYRNNQWVFEEGTFNENNSYNLRVRHLIDMMDEDVTS